MSATEATAAAPRSARIISAVGAIGALTLAAHRTGAIFGEPYVVWPAIAGVIVTFVAALVVARRHPPIGVGCVVIGIAGSMSVAALTVDAAPFTSIIDGLVGGIADIIAARWPAPPTGPAVAVIAGLTAAAGGISGHLLARGRTTAAIVPPLALLGSVALLSAEAGAPSPAVLVPFGAGLLLVLQGSRTTPHSTTSAILTVAMLAVSAIVPITMQPAPDDDRYDPRTSLDDPASTEDDQLSPLSRVEEWRSLDRPTVMFATSFGEPTRWRLVGLTRYDGTAWQPAADYRPASTDLAAADPARPVVPVEVTIGGLDSVWLPQLERTVSVTELVSTDGTSSGLVPQVRPVAGATYGLDVQPADVLPAQLVGASFPPGGDDVASIDVPVPPAVQELASRIVAGGTTDYERAEGLAAFLREQYVLDPDTPPGHSLAVVELFLQTTRRGRDEQFVAAYGLLAAAAGLPVRIAVGFDTVTDRASGGTLGLAEKAVAWPEIEFDGVGWVAFDPVPDPLSSGSPAAGDGAVAPLPDMIAEPPPTTLAPVTADASTDEADSALTTTGGDAAVPASVKLAGTVIAALLTVLALYSVVVLAWKQRRRRRRRRAHEPHAGAVGAFLSSVDMVVDLGGAVRPSATDRQLVTVAHAVVGEPAHVLEPVASMATAAVFAPDPPTPAQVDTAWERVEEFERATADDVGRWRYLRARLSMRSLRRGLGE